VAPFFDEKNESELSLSYTGDEWKGYREVKIREKETLRLAPTSPLRNVGRKEHENIGTRSGQELKRKKGFLLDPDFPPTLRSGGQVIRMTRSFFLIKIDRNL